MHQTLRELHPDVAAAADAASRAAQGTSVTTALPKLDQRWPVSGAGLSDLDPEIAAELLLGSGVDIRLRSHEYEENSLGRLSELVIRRHHGSDLNQFIDRGMVSGMA